jgi:hypothetical protein
VDEAMTKKDAQAAHDTLNACEIPWSLCFFSDLNDEQAAKLAGCLLVVLLTPLSTPSRKFKQHIGDDEPTLERYFKYLKFTASHIRQNRG